MHKSFSGLVVFVAELRVLFLKSETELPIMFGRLLTRVAVVGSNTELDSQKLLVVLGQTMFMGAHTSPQFACPLRVGHIMSRVWISRSTLTPS